MSLLRMGTRGLFGFYYKGKYYVVITDGILKFLLDLDIKLFRNLRRPLNVDILRSGFCFCRS